MHGLSALRLVSPRLVNERGLPDGIIILGSTIPTTTSDCNTCYPKHVPQYTSLVHKHWNQSVMSVDLGSAASSVDNRVQKFLSRQAFALMLTSEMGNIVSTPSTTAPEIPKPHPCLGDHALISNSFRVAYSLLQPHVCRAGEYSQNLLSSPGTWKYGGRTLAR